MSQELIEARIIGKCIEKSSLSLNHECSSDFRNNIMNGELRILIKSIAEVIHEEINVLKKQVKMTSNLNTNHNILEGAKK